MVELPELEEGLGQFEMKINLDDLVVLLSELTQAFQQTSN